MNTKKTIAASKQQIINNYLDLAREFQAQQLYGKAEETLQMALDISPNNPRILSALINLYLKQGWYDQAQSLLRQVLQKHKDFNYAYYLRGKLFEARGKTGQAIMSYKKALKEKKGDEFILRRLIPLLIQRKRYQEALNLIYNYREILNNPDFMVQFEAMILTQMGNPARASQLLREKVNTQPDAKHFVYQYLKTFVENSRQSPRELYTVLQKTIPGLAPLTDSELDGLEVEYLIKKGKLEEALELIHVLIEREPQKAYWKKRQAFLLLELERHEAALPILRELFLKDPTDVFVRTALESYYLHRNKIREWKQLLKETFSLHPNRLELFGLIRRASLHQDWLASCQLTFEAFKSQVAQLPIRPFNAGDPTFQKLPLYVIENFIFYLNMNDRLPDARILWEFLQQRKAKTDLPFHVDDIEHALPIWIFGLQFYFALREFKSHPQFVPARFQKEWIGAFFTHNHTTVFLEIKNLLIPPKRKIKSLRKISGGYIWRLINFQFTEQINSIPFLSLDHFKEHLTQLQTTLEEKSR